MNSTPCSSSDGTDRSLHVVLTKNPLDIFQLETPTGPVPMRGPRVHISSIASRLNARSSMSKGAHALSAFEDLSEKLLVLVAQGPATRCGCLRSSPRISYSATRAVSWLTAVMPGRVTTPGRRAGLRDRRFGALPALPTASARRGKTE